MAACIFCQIAAGTAPSHPVWSDSSTLAFMDINPAVDGHVLVVPRRHAADLWEIEPADARAVMDTSVRVARMIRDALQPDGLNIVHATGRAAFQSVFHFHVHLIPRRFGDPIKPPWSLHERRGDPAELERLAGVIRSAG